MFSTNKIFTKESICDRVVDCAGLIIQLVKHTVGSNPTGCKIKISLIKNKKASYTKIYISRIFLACFFSRLKWLIMIRKYAKRIFQGGAC